MVGAWDGRHDRSMAQDGAGHHGTRPARRAPVLIAALATALAAGLLTGCSSAQGDAGAVSLTTYSTDDGPRARAILTGAIGDYGEAINVNPDGSTDPEHNSQLELALKEGSFRLDLTGLGKQLADEFSHFPQNTTTCSGVVSVSQPATVVAGSGTGAYVGVTGSFVLTVTITEVEAHPRARPPARSWPSR